MGKVNAKGGRRMTGVKVPLCGPKRPQRYLSAEDQLGQENAMATAIRRSGTLTSRGGPSPEKTMGERRRR